MMRDLDTVDHVLAVVVAREHEQVTLRGDDPDAVMPPDPEDMDAEDDED